MTTRGPELWESLLGEDVGHLDINNERVWTRSDIETRALKILRLGPINRVRHGLLAVRIDAHIVSFVVFDGLDGLDEYSHVFHGSGPGGEGTLRELRHTWWGDDNAYIYYPKPRLIAAAFEGLAEWFDVE